MTKKWLSALQENIAKKTLLNRKIWTNALGLS